MLFHVGGCGFIDHLRRILKTLMRTTVSVKYNLTGVKGKLPFNQLISLKSTVQGYIYCWHIGYPFGAKIN